MIVEDGILTQLNQETQRGVCDITGGEKLLESLG
jgi:peroxiredoxin